MTKQGLDFHALKSFSIERVLHDRGLLHQFRIRGDRITGPCPIHGGDNPNAFVVTRSRNLWYCFTQCQRGGDVIDLLAGLDGQQRITAARHLADAQAGTLAIDRRQGPVRRPRPNRFRPFKRRLRLDPFAPFIQRKGISPATARLFDAGQWHSNGWLAGCVAVRLHDNHGNPLGYAARRLASGCALTAAKWKMPPCLPKRTVLYSWHRAQARLDLPVVLVECPWAVMRLYQLGLPAVALLGTSLSTAQHQLIASASRIIIMLDGDQTGRLAAKRIARQFKHLPLVDRVHLPDGYDPDDLSDSELAALVAPFFP